jgi:vacuolar protein 8
MNLGKSRDALYENVLAENEREAVADLLQYLENVSIALTRRPMS